MLGRNHFIFNFFTICPFYYASDLLKDPYAIIFLVIAIAISNAPDVDLSHSKRKISKLIFYAFFATFALFMGKKDFIKHRGITHSIQGIICFSSLIFLLWFSLCYTMNYWTSVIFPMTIIASYALHVACDAMTIGGIDCALKGNKIRGILITGKNDTVYVMIYALIMLFALMLNLGISFYFLFSVFALSFPIIAFKLREILSKRRRVR